MKRIIFYRIVSILLVLSLGCSLYIYNQKNCIVNKVVKNEIVNPNYVFFGDSITYFCDFNKYFKDIPVVNSGICGDKTGDLLNRMSDVYKYNPSKVFLLIGINDLMHDEHDDKISTDIAKITSEIHEKLPYTEIYIESIYPNKEGHYGYVLPDRIEKVNNEIKQICKDNDYTYINLFDKLKNDKRELKDEYTDDGLHVNSKGYDVVIKELKKYLK